MGRTKSTTKTCPDGTVVRFNQKCPVPTSGGTGQTVLAPVNTSLPVISGTVQKGSSLTCSTGGWDDAPTSFAYQWKVNGVNSGTGSSYAVKAGDIGYNVTCVVTASNAGGSASATASGVGPVIDLAPANTVAPVCSGTATVGQTLSVTNGTWTNTPTSYAYQWKRGGTAISGANAGTYALVSPDNGATITCAVTATNSGGSSSVTSNSIGPVGSVGTVSTVYDTRFGTTDATSGWTDFPLHSGCRRIWVDSVNGNDSHDGLSAATAKATYSAAAALYAGAGWTSGDHLMVAGGEGQTYTNSYNTDFHLNGKMGISLAYPIVEQCYDSTDPTNTAKYGKLTGGKRPIINVDTTGFGLHFFSDSGARGQGTSVNIAISGIFFDGQGRQNSDTQVVFTGTGHAGVCIQNCTFKETELVIDTGNAMAVGEGDSYEDNHRITRCSFYGQNNTSSANASGLYLEGTKSALIEDCVFNHCGWKVGASRYDAFSDGGAFYLGHADYISPYNKGVTIRRVFYCNNALDGFNARASTKGDCIVSMWEPEAGHLGGWSGGPTDNPNGSLNQVDDWAIIGCAKDINGGFIGREGFHISATLPGSYVNNMVASDSAYVSDSEMHAVSGSHDSGYLDAYCEVKNSIIVNYAPAIEYYGDDTAHIHYTFTNCRADISFSGLSGSGNSAVTLSSFPSAKTAATLVTEMGYSDAPAMWNAMLYRPDLPWAQAAATVWMASFGKGLTNTPPCLPPSIGSDTPTVVFASSHGTLGLSSTAFSVGTPKTVNITGCPAGWAIAGNTLPTGFSLKSYSRHLVWDGTGSAGSKTISLTHSIENVGTHTDSISVTVS